MPQARTVLDIGSSNRTLSLYRQLSASRSARRKHGAFALEGYRLVADAARSDVEVSALLMSKGAMERYGAELTAALPKARVLLLSDALAKSVSETAHTQGVFAIAKMPPPKEALPRAGDRCLLLHCLQDPANVGAILRTAEALGTDGIYLCGCCDLFSPKVCRASMGAIFRAPVFLTRDLDALFERCEEQGLPRCAAVVDANARKLGDFSFENGAMVLIGNEGSGLPKEISERCDCPLTIPMRPDANSLNAAVAAALFLWEMRREGGTRG